MLAVFFTRQKVKGNLGIFACLTATCAHHMSVVIKYNEVIGRYNVSHFPHLINQNSTLDLYLSCFVSVVRGGGINRLEEDIEASLLCSYYFRGKALPPHIEAKTEAAKSGSPQLVERATRACSTGGGWGRRRRRAVCVRKESQQGGKWGQACNILPLRPKIHHSLDQLQRLPVSA